MVQVYCFAMLPAVTDWHSINETLSFGLFFVLGWRFLRYEGFYVVERKCGVALLDVVLGFDVFFIVLRECCKFLLNDLLVVFPAVVFLSRSLLAMVKHLTNSSQV